MIEISQAEFRTHKVYDSKNGLTTERRWFKHDDLLGIVLFDTVDRDWSWVALTPVDGTWCAFAVGHSLPGAEVAVDALEQTLLQGVPDTPSETEQDIHRIAAAAGLTRDELEAVVAESIREDQPGDPYERLRQRLTALVRSGLRPRP